MAKKGAGKSKEKQEGRPWLLRILLKPWLWVFAFLIIVSLLIFSQWWTIVSWVSDVIAAVWELLGWGLALIVAAILIAVLVIWRKPSSLIRRWNWWLGGIAFFLTAWGILAFFPAEGILSDVNLGGSFGLGIIGDINVIGALRVLGLFIIGTIFVAPKASFRAVAGFVKWVAGRFRRRPKPVIEKPQPSVTIPAEESAKPPQRIFPGILRKEEPELEITTPTPTPEAPSQAKKDLRQVAQDVWKKYGESLSLITIDGWKLPPIDILDVAPEVEYSQADNAQRARLIEEALVSYGVEAKVVQINAGPTVTQFGVEPGWDRKYKEVREKDKDGNVRVRQEEVSKTRIKVERITSLANDLALALAAHSIRIEAPVPGKSIVGIEVPNTVSSIVSLRGVIETSVFQKLKAKSRLSLALGKGAGGEAIAGDLGKMPHLLIAGATGSGKTVCLNAIICCLLLHNTPYDVKFIMVDPKRVEMTAYNGIPHLVTPVIVDTDKAISALRWLSQEMDRRYQKLAAAGARNIEGYNKNKQGAEKMLYLVLVIDELADLMMRGMDEVERILCRLAQLARATGIHLVVATQRPSVDVVTGLIKANFPTRISFAVTSQVDSRTILDSVGAEKLLGGGDMLYMPTEAAKPKRLQGCYVSDPETERLVYFWGGQKREEMASLKLEELTPSLVAPQKGIVPEDPFLERARQLLKEHKHISTSFLQRKLSVGYPRAARIMEQLQLEMEVSKKEEEPES